MSDETDYEALEKSVKYIPRKGKKAEKMSCLWKNWSQRCRLLDFGSQLGQTTCKLSWENSNNFTGNCHYCHKKGH